MTSIDKKVTCVACGNHQEERYKYCQKCQMDMPRLNWEKYEPKISKPLGKFKKFLKFHPLISFVLSLILLIVIGSIFWYFTRENWDKELWGEFVMLFYLVFTGYIACLRGRSLWWCIVPFGLIFVSFLPIKTRN